MNRKISLLYPCASCGEKGLHTTVNGVTTTPPNWRSVEVRGQTHAVCCEMCGMRLIKTQMTYTSTASFLRRKQEILEAAREVLRQTRKLLPD